MARGDGGGRPAKWKQIDVQQLEACAERQWTVTEIAAFFRVSHDLIERRFASNIKEARQRGHAKIRDLQFKRALEGSDTMIKHLSEHYLDQHQKSETKQLIQAEVKAISDVDLKKRIAKIESDV